MDRIRASRAALGLLLTAAISGCLPDRDNPLDPASAPDARLRVTDATDPDSPAQEPVCLAVDTADAWPVAATITRARCLSLDASESTDPQGDSIRFRFLEVDSGGDEIAVLAETTSAAIVLAAGVRTALEVGAHFFTVEVIDRGGARGRTAPSGVVVVNARPVAVAGPPTVLPIGGFPWDPNPASISVRFDGSRSFDPDGDELTWSWTFPALLGQPANVSGEVVDRLVDPSQDGQLSGVLVVSDGIDESASTAQLVSIREGAHWLSTNGDSLELSPVDLGQTGIDLGLNVNELNAALLEGPPARAALAWQAGNSTSFDVVLRRLDWPDGGNPVDDILGSQSSLEEIRVAVDETGGKIWVLAAGYESPSTLYSANVEGGGVTELEILSPAEDDVGDPFLIVAEDGAIWIDRILGSASRFRVSPTGTVTPLAAEPGRMTFGMAARPGTNEIWVLEIPRIGSLDPAAASQTAAFVVYDGTTSVELPLGVDYAFAVGFSGPGDVWTVLPDRGLARLDVNALFESDTYEDALLALFPVVRDASRIFSDRAGGVWTVDSEATDIMFHVNAAGAAVPFQHANALLVDPSGRLWIADPSALIRSVSPLPALADFPGDPLPFSADRNLDGRGGIWVSTLFPPTLWSLEADGSVGDAITRFTWDGQTALIPPSLRVTISPDGTTAYLYAYDAIVGDEAGMVRVDLRNSPILTGETFLTKDEQESLYGVFIPSAPVPGDPEFVWSAVAVGTGLQLVTLDTNGDVDPVFVPPEPYAGAALLPATNDLCVATYFAPGILRMRRIDTTGAVLSTSDQNLLEPAFSLDIYTAGIGSVCWAAVSNVAIPGNVSTWYLIAHDPSGVVRHVSAAVEGHITSIVALDGDRVWVTMRRENSTSVLRSYEFEPILGSNVVTLRDIVIDDGLRLVEQPD